LWFFDKSGDACSGRKPPYPSGLRPEQASERRAVGRVPRDHEGEHERMRRKYKREKKIVKAPCRSQ
jgi:hypothetical protein